MDDQKTDREGGGSVDKSRRFVRVLFWGAVLSALFALGKAIADGNSRGIVIGSVLTAISLPMAAWIEWRMAADR